VTAEEYTSLTAPSAFPIRRFELIAELSMLGASSLRSLRAVAAGTATQFDTDKLAQLETKAMALRTGLATV